MKQVIQSLFIAGMVCCLTPAHGGSVITTNLPANTAIINISGTQDYVQGYNGDKSFWYAPASTLGTNSLLKYTFQPGAYGFRLVDPADALRLYPALTSAQTNTIFTAWTFNTPWITSYVAFDSAAATNNTIGQLFDGASGTNYGNGGVPLYGSAQAAYNAAVSGGFYNLIRTGTNGYDSTNFLTSYTFNSVQTLIFATPDYDPGDNGGGVSVLVTPLGTSSVLPELYINLIAANSAVVYWTNAAGFNLQTNGDLTMTNWSNYSGTILSSGGTNSVAVSPSSGALFFRLKQ